MNKTKRLFTFALALLMAVSMLAGCNGGNNDTTDPSNSSSNWNGEPQYGGHLNVRIAGRPTGLDAFKQTGAWRMLYTTCVYDTALTRDDENNICPGVCDFEISEDQTQIKMWARDGYIFSNGDPADIYDVEASYQRAMKLQDNMKLYVKPYIKSMTVENDGEKDVMTVVFTEYNEKCWSYFATYKTWCPILPKEICEKYTGSYIVDEVEDAIGTGPYVFTEFTDSVIVSVKKRADYVPVENTGSGFAGTKIGYMDTISFHYNNVDASACLAVLSGDYDMTEVIPTEYKSMAEQKGLVLSALPSDQRTFINFNTRGTGVCAKYPSLRRAVMAAIDYQEALDVITDGSAIYEGENANFLMDPLYNTDAFTKQDYFGASNQEVVDKYLAMAREEGYNGEPIQVVNSNSRDDVPTVLCDALERCGINYKLEVMEATTYTAFINNFANNWDVYFSWITSAYTPTSLEDAIIKNNFGSETKDRLIKEMSAMDPTSDEYLAKWEELANHMAEGCYIGFMSAIDWWWWHPATLHPNDNGRARFMYNAFWEDPNNHQK